MSDPSASPTRRAAVLAGVAAAAAPAVAGAAAGPEHDWAWEAGRWNVRHRQLKARLAGSGEWIEFDGTCAMQLTMGGLGNIEDNVIGHPGGTYRAMAVRSFDARAGQWRIWWLDGRNPVSLDPPVTGGFKDGAGVFLGEDVLDGRPIKVRYQWSKITPVSAQWDQAFSADGGASWETNWIMAFARA